MIASEGIEGIKGIEGIEGASLVGKDVCLPPELDSYILIISGSQIGLSGSVLRDGGVYWGFLCKLCSDLWPSLSAVQSSVKTPALFVSFCTD